MITFLIADDEQIERKFLRKVIETRRDRFLVAAEAANGQEVVDLAAEHLPDIVIMDINMPVYNGIEAARKIKESQKNSIIILNSAYAEFDFAQRAIDFCLDAYLVKPSREEEILGTIERCLQRKSVDSLGSSLLSDQGSDPKYPFHLSDKAEEAVHRKDLFLLRNTAQELLDFFKSRQNHLREYRLFIINTIFSIERALNEGMFKEGLVSLVDGSRSMQNISQETAWYSILAETESYFHRLLSFMEGVCEARQDKMNIILEHVDGNFCNDISMEELSDLVFLSPTYISHLFHERTGQSFREYLHRKRIDYACHLLKETRMTINDIAEQCGYASVNNFYRIFKRIARTTPVECRKGGIRHEHKSS